MTKPPKHCILKPPDICLSFKHLTDFTPAECKKCKYNADYQKAKIDYNEISKGTCAGVLID